MTTETRKTSDIQAGDIILFGQESNVVYSIALMDNSSVYEIEVHRTLIQDDKLIDLGRQKMYAGINSTQVVSVSNQ